jgi:hypothetical protein
MEYCSAPPSSRIPSHDPNRRLQFVAEAEANPIVGATLLGSKLLFQPQPGAAIGDSGRTRTCDLPLRRRLPDENAT